MARRRPWEIKQRFHFFLNPRPGGTVTVTTVGRATCGTAGCAEPSSTAPTIGTTNITMEEYQCSLYICRNDLEDMLEDTLVEINNALAECIDICIDNAFIANIGTYGGSIAYDKGTMSASMIAEAMGSMRNGNRRKSLWAMFFDRNLRTRRFNHTPRHRSRSIARLAIRECSYFRRPFSDYRRTHHKVSRT